MATLKQIAEAAGVHASTASAVLNGSGGNTRVSADTRNRVLLTAKKLSYIPNEAARRLRTGNSNLVGFFGGDFRNPFFAELVAKLEAELAQRGLQLVVAHLAGTKQSCLQEAFVSLQRQMVRGIICWEEAPKSVAEKMRLEVPILSIGFTHFARPGVWLDLNYAIELAIGEMIGRGFRKLGFYAPEMRRESPSVQTRCSAFARECRKRRLLRPAVVSYEGESWDLEAAARGAQQLLKEYEQIEAWVGFNDIAALGLLSNLPFESASRVLCFDGTSVARCWPGGPPRLDLQIPDLAKRAAIVVSGEAEAAKFGSPEEWLRPTLGRQNGRVLP